MLFQFRHRHQDPGKDKLRRDTSELVQTTSTAGGDSFPPPRRWPRRERTCAHTSEPVRGAGDPAPPLQRIRDRPDVQARAGTEDSIGK